MRPQGRLAVGLAAAATTILLVSIGIAAAMLPQRPAEVLPAPAAQAGNGPHAAEPAVAAAAPSAAPVTADPGALISDTFNQLQATPITGAAPAAADIGTAAAGTPDLSVPTTRFVQTIHVAVPAAAAPAPVAALAPPADTSAAAPVVAAAPASGEPPADSTVETAAAAPAAVAAPSVAEAPAVADPLPGDAPAPGGALAAETAPEIEVAQADPAPAATAPAPVDPAPVPLVRAGKRGAARGGFAVRSTGVTVRSGPARGRGTLFNLGAGEKVSVISRQHGWAEIIDARGRRGWVYGTFLSGR